MSLQLLPWPAEFISSSIALYLSTSVGLAMVVCFVLRPKESVNRTVCKMVPEHVYDLCSDRRTVTSELARNPTESPEHVFRRLYQGKTKHRDRKSVKEKLSVDQEDSLQRAYECGNWGPTKPSRLFLKIYHDALCTLEKNPMVGMVSPPLIGSYGTAPLTIVAPLPDICRHMANCIVRAEHEVFLATNFWINSDASTLVTNAFRELSRRAGERGTKIVVKMIYDRGSPRQVCENRLLVPEKQFVSEKVKLPPLNEIPNIDFQLVNFHRPILGTFHAKFMVVDRKLALLQSSNIQDNDNLEMMVHVEGPIVDSLYDAGLVSWGRTLGTPLPLLHTSSASSSWKNEEVEDNGNENGEPLPQLTMKNQQYDSTIQDETRRVNSSLLPRTTKSVTCHLNTTIQPNTTGDSPDSDQHVQMKPYALSPTHEPFPMAMVNREPWGGINHTSTHTPQNAAFLSAISNAKHSIFIQTPNMNAEPLMNPLLEAVRRGVVVTCYLCLGYNDAGELLPFQNGTNEMIAHRLYTTLRTDEEKSRLHIFNYVGKDQTKPLHNRFKERSCHIKLMIIDESVGIQGNGNLDTQSFYHSQEINLLYDSPTVCRSWLETINRNQNTALYGEVSPQDGCWHDPKTGELPPCSIGVDPGRFSWMKGIIGAVQRVRGAGGF